jgi:hypothetical protein
VFLNYRDFLEKMVVDVEETKPDFVVIARNLAANTLPERERAFKYLKNVFQKLVSPKIQILS